MPKFVMPSAATNGKVSKEKKRKNLAVFAKTVRLRRFIPAKLLSSNVKTGSFCEILNVADTFQKCKNN